MDWTTACPDWEARIVEGRSLIPFDPLFQDEATAALDVFRELRVVDVQGAPTMGELCRPWIVDFVASVFGAYDSDVGRRLITEFFLLISKKNSKSTTAAGIMMTALIRNWRESAEFLILAPTVEIANNSFYPARDMVRKDPELDALFQVQDHIRTITNRVNGGVLKVVAADAETVGGKKATGVLVDELHAFGKQPNAEGMLLEACGGLASRPEGFTIFLSTQSAEAPAGIFRKKLMYARGVRDGLIDDKRFLPVLYEFPERMVKAKAYLDPKNWYITNPNLGASVDREHIERLGRIAENDGPESQCGFFSKHLNVEIGLALRSDGWAGAPFWEVQALAGGLTLAQLIERCEVATVGIDGGGLDDLLGLCVLGRERETHNWLAWTRAWAHKIVLERRKEIAAKLLDFVPSGDLVIVENIGEDIDELADLVEQVHASRLLDRADEKHQEAIGVDQAGIGAIIDALVDRGIDIGKIIGITQGWRMTSAVKTAERKLAEGTILHGGQPMMAWCVGNAKVEPRGNAIVITKQASGTAKIDPFSAFLDAVTLMSLNPEAQGDPADFLANPIIA